MATPKTKPLTSRQIAHKIVKQQPMPPLIELKKDLRAAAKTLSSTEVRYLVDQYYAIQDYRKAAGNQVIAMDKAGEPASLIAWIFCNMDRLEDEIRQWLDIYTESEPLHVGQWLKSITGIGPIISAGLLAHIDIVKAPTVGHIWRFAGLDPTVTWAKGARRPWNASLKTLCWKIGESFVKVSGRDDDVYGKLYLARKAEEERHNDAGDFAVQAAAKLERFKIGKGTDAYAAYSAGRLPPGHLHARAKRYAVKLFLAHWHQVAYFAHWGKPAPKPYVISHLHHAHEIVCPNWPFD